MQKATKAAMVREISRAGPAIAAAGAITAKIPAPRIAARPVETASNMLSCGRNVRPFGSAAMYHATLAKEKQRLLIFFCHP